MADGVIKFGVGQPLRRLEDDRLLRGAGRYVDDIRHAGQHFAAFLRAPEAHAVINSIDTAEAKRVPGVAAVWTSVDAAAAGLRPLTNKAQIPSDNVGPIADVSQPALAGDRVRYVGQPVAMAVAATPEAARDAVEAVVLTMEALPAVTDGAAARSPDAPTLHDAAPGNLALEYSFGDAAAVAAAFEAAEVRVSVPVKSQRLVVATLEPRAINAVYEAAFDRWLIHVASQGAHSMRANLAENLGVPADRLRVVTPDVGGGFGMKLMNHPEYALIAAAARDLRRPVAWTADRSESFLSDAQGRDLDSVAEGAFDADGRLRAMRFRSTSNLGAFFSQFGAAVHGPFSAPLIGGMYGLDALYTQVAAVFTNTTPTDAYRGAGRPEIIYATERVMDAGARALNMDPAELRRRNLLSADRIPSVSPGGSAFDSGDPKALFDRALDAADWSSLPERRSAARAAGRFRGGAAAFYMERTGGGPVENARLRVRGDGRIEAWIGTQSTGQGHETAWAQLIAETLGAPPSVIDFPPGDSDLLPAGGGTGGARSLIMAHRCFFLAAEDVIEQARKTAAAQLEAHEADVAFSPEAGGAFRIVGTDRRIGLFDVAAHSRDAFGEAAILGVGDVSDRVSTYPNGVHVAEVLLDPATGAVTLDRFNVIDDFGRVVNPLLVEGQVLGGAAQGAGQALYEAARFDPHSGQPLAASFMDYAMPRAGDFPMMDTRLDESWPATTNPLGVKGCGEAGAVGATPAIVLAICDALQAAGVAPATIEALQSPFTPQTLWRALRDAGAAETA